MSNPDEVSSSKEVSIISALWYFQDRVLSKIEVNNNTSVKSLTYYINSGLKGLSDREDKTEDAEASIANCIEFNVN